MRVVVVGAGAVGARAATELFAEPNLRELVIVDADHRRAEAVVGSLGPPARVSQWLPPMWLSGLESRRPPPRGAPPDVVVIACPPPQLTYAKEAIAHGAHVVSMSGSVKDVWELL